MLDQVMLFEVALLSKCITSDLASMRFDTFMHPHVVKHVPSLRELLITAIVSANVRDLESGQRLVPDLHLFMLKRFKEIFIDLFFCNFWIALNDSFSELLIILKVRLS